MAFVPTARPRPKGVRTVATKLFELLAVDGQLKGQAERTRTDLRATFEKKRHLFEEKRRTYQPSQEGATPVVEEQSDIQATVASELRWLADLWSRAVDTSYQVAEGNMQARSDVVLDDGTILLSQVPATALLELEKRGAELQEVIASIPTLDPAKGFRPDDDRGQWISRAREVRKTRTAKVVKPLVLYPATTEHPAQTQVISVDDPVGQILEQEWSGLFTPSQKADMLSRAEAFRRAVKTALHRANAVEMNGHGTVAAKMFGFVLGSAVMTTDPGGPERRVDEAKAQSQGQK